MRLALALVLVAFALGLRQPTWNDHILFIDEAIYYAYAARLAIPGAHLYTHTADQKPPLGPLTYWLALRISNAHAITVVHLFTSAAIAVTALLLLLTSCVAMRGPWPGFCAGGLYVLIGSSIQPFDEPWFACSSLEHFQAPWVAIFILALFLALREGRLWWAVAAGAAVGIAALYKPNVVALLAAGWLTVGLLIARGSVSVRGGFALGAACTAVTLAIVAAVPVYYAALGHFDAWWFYNVDMLRAYQGLGAPLQAKARLLAKLIPLLVPLLVALTYAVWTGLRGGEDVWVRALMLLLVLSWLVLFVSLIPGLHKGHYLVQCLPIQCLLIGMLIVDAGRRVVRRRRLVRAGFLAVYLAVVMGPLADGLYDLVAGWRLLGTRAGRDDYLQIHRAFGTVDPLVRYIRSHSADDDLIYVHSEAPELYFLAQRRPAASDPTGSWVAILPSDSTANRLLADLQATPPRFIVQLDYRRYGRFGEVLEKWPQLRAWITANYREVPGFPHAQLLERRGSQHR